MRKRSLSGCLHVGSELRKPFGRRTAKPQRGDLSKQLAEWRAADLDELDELKAAEAAGINNCGEEDQLVYLLTTLPGAQPGSR